MNIIKNTEVSRKKQRPLERVIGAEETEGRLDIRTTYEHIARRYSPRLTTNCLARATTCCQTVIRFAVSCRSGTER